MAGGWFKLCGPLDLQEIDSQRSQPQKDCDVNQEELVEVGKGPAVLSGVWLSISEVGCVDMQRARQYLQRLGGLESSKGDIDNGHTLCASLSRLCAALPGFPILCPLQEWPERVFSCSLAMKRLALPWGWWPRLLYLEGRKNTTSLSSAFSDKECMRRSNMNSVPTTPEPGFPTVQFENKTKKKKKNSLKWFALGSLQVWNWKNKTQLAPWGWTAWLLILCCCLCSKVGIHEMLACPAVGAWEILAK